MCEKKVRVCKKKKKKNNKRAITVYSLKVRDGKTKVDISVSTTPMLVLAIFFGIYLLKRGKRDSGKGLFHAESSVGSLISAPFGSTVIVNNDQDKIEKLAD
ncbi:MAG: hypothetical protein IKP47_06420 [Ruminococcus sp.]|nr:hypothetical protein [Ruminococcus sp.]